MCSALYLCPFIERYVQTMSEGTKIVQKTPNRQEEEGERHNIVTTLRNTEVQFITDKHKIFQCLKRTTRKPYFVAASDSILGLFIA
jgi:hypothetical protein